MGTVQLQQLLELTPQFDNQQQTDEGSSIPASSNCDDDQHAPVANAVDGNEAWSSSTARKPFRREAHDAASTCRDSS